MASHVWPGSSLDAVARAFEVLDHAPTPIMLDGRDVAGLPQQPMTLNQLRTLVLSRATGQPVRDAVWGELVRRARRDGPAWVIAVAGMALPGLRAAAVRLMRERSGVDAADVDAELLACFLERLMVIDVDQPGICGRLIDAGVRAVRWVQVPDVVRCRPSADVVGAAPRLPWDHPDWVLTRAVAAGVVDPDEALLIGATRLECTPIGVVARQLAIDAPLAVKWRRDAELRLRDAIRAGDLAYTSAAGRRRARRSAAVG